MSPAISSAIDAIRAAMTGEIRLDYGSSSPDKIHIYPVFEPRIDREAFLSTIVQLDSRTSFRLVRLLTIAAHEPCENFSRLRQQLLHGFFVANLTLDQIADIDRQKVRKAAA